MNSIIYLEVVRFYPPNELKFLKLNSMYPQAVVELSTVSFNRIKQIAPAKIISRKLINSILVNLDRNNMRKLICLLAIIAFIPMIVLSQSLQPKYTFERKVNMTTVSYMTFSPCGKLLAY